VIFAKRVNPEERRRRRGTGALCLLAAAFWGAFLALTGTGAQEDATGPVAAAARDGDGAEGHGMEGKPYDPADYTPGQRERVDRLFTLVICACPKEGYTKTLAGCPDGCADEQKREVRAGVKAGKTDQQILDEQVMVHGTKQVLSLPDSRLAHLVPYLALAVMVLVVLAILVASVRPRPPAGAAIRGAAASPPGKASAAGPRADGPSAGEGDPEEEARLEAAVERDLAEMDE